MKKRVSVIILAILICLACMPSFAQKSRANTNSGVRGAIAEYENIQAFSDGQGVFIRWEMRAELGNIGFFIYRVTADGNEPVSPLILGGIRKSGQKTVSGEIYDFYDPQGELGSTYIIENLFRNGTRQSTGQFNPQYTSNFPASTGNTKAELEIAARSRNGSVRKDALALPADLQALVNRHIVPPNPEMQRELVTQQGVKIAVKKEGMYRVTRAELQAAGFDVNSDPTNWRLFMNGNEQAIIAEPTGQYIDFYGRGLDVRETDTRTYYLISGTVPGKRMVTKILNNIGGNVLSRNYRLSVETKDRQNYDARIRNGDIENYFGRAVFSSIPPCPSPNPLDPPCPSLNLTGIDLQGLNAVATVKFQGFDPGAHAVKAFINGQQFGFIYGANYDNFSAQLSLPPSLLVEGQNVLQFATTRSSDVVYFDSIKIEFSRKYVADQNKALFFTPGYRKMDVDGFTSANIRVFDTTLDGSPQLITDLPIIQNGSTFAVRMPSNRPSVMYAVEDSGLLQSPSITANNASTLSTANNQADMIIISYSDPDFMAAAERWADYRRSTAGGGFNVKVVDVADVYDEFSYGEHSAAGISQFLRYAKNSWQNPKPRYILLMGDASSDARNYKGFGYNDLIPSAHVELIFEDTGSDEAMADFNNDGLAEMAIGRIPARTTAVVDSVLAKTMAFETPANQSLDRGAVCAFDRPDGFDFEAMCHALMDQMPASMPKTYINRMLPPGNTSPDPMGRDNVINAVNQGPLIVNYSGHGNLSSWASLNFFSSLDAPSLTNTNRTSIMTMLTCLNGFFISDKSDSLGEALLKANGGAVATWASTTETTPDYQLTMGAPFFMQIGLGNIRRIGDLVVDAKTSIAGSDVGYSWVLLGDPALKVRP